MLSGPDASEFLEVQRFASTQVEFGFQRGQERDLFAISLRDVWSKPWQREVALLVQPSQVAVVES